LLAFLLPAGGDQAERRAVSYSNCAASSAGAGLSCFARRSLACQRRSGGAAGGILFGLRGIVGRGGIGLLCSPFPRLPAASLQEPENAEGYFFYYAGRL